MNRIIVVIMIMASSVFAGPYDVFWVDNGSQGYWDNAKNWKDGKNSKGWGVPGMIKERKTWNSNAGFARIEKGSVVVDAKHQPNGRVERVYIGGEKEATLVINGGSFKCHKFLTSYDEGWNSKFEMNGGQVFCDMYTCLGEGPDSKTVFNLNGGVYTANNHVYCPQSKIEGAQVEINIDGGVFNIDENIYLGNKANTLSILNLKSGKIAHTGGNFGIGFGGKAILNQTGGDFVTNSYDRIRVGWKNGAYGEIRLAGGKFIVNKELAIHRGTLKVVGTKSSKIMVQTLVCMDGKEEIVEFDLDEKGVTPIKVKGDDGVDFDDSTLVVKTMKGFNAKVGDEIPLIFAKKFKKDKTFKFKDLSEKYDFDYTIEDCKGSKCLKIKVMGMKR